LGGGEAEREEFIAGYPFDISAVSDNRPFFFQYYKWSDALQPGKRIASEGGYFITRLPLAHWTLLASLVQIIVLSLVFIIAPLMRIRSGLKGCAGKLPFMLYFAMLGLGFIFVEIVLIQKFIVYLGQPLYSISVILALLLMFSGVGSYLTQGIGRRSYGALWGVLVILIVGIIGINFAASAVIKSTLHSVFGVKLVLTSLVMLPLGLLMGMPFPLGIRIVDARAKALVPWVWGVNACLSVIGTMLAIFLSSIFGFNFVMVVAAGLYLVGLVAMVVAMRGVRVEQGEKIAC
jgi:hypothetical protein